MSFDYDVEDEVELAEQEYLPDSAEGEYSSEFSDKFEEIDFGALGIDPQRADGRQAGNRREGSDAGRSLRGWCSAVAWK